MDIVVGWEDERDDFWVCVEVVFDASAIDTCDCRMGELILLAISSVLIAELDVSPDEYGGTVPSGVNRILRADWRWLYRVDGLVDG